MTTRRTGHVCAIAPGSGAMRGRTNMRSARPWLVSVLLIALPFAATADDVAAIARDFDAHTRILDPVRAGQRGDRDALRRWPDNSPAAVAARNARLLAFRDRLRALDPAALPREAALTHALMVDRVEVALAGCTL